MNTYDQSTILSDGTVIGGYEVNIGDGTLYVPQDQDYFLDASVFMHIEINVMRAILVLIIRLRELC